MTTYLPQPADLVAVLATWAVAVLLLLTGAGLCGRRTPPEYQILAGWGALCLLLTGWGVLLPASLRLPAVLFTIAAIAVLATRRRPSREAWLGLGRVLALSLPLWLILAPIRPSQPDTFLNLLPNAVYLVDYARLPDAALAPSHSLLPGAPYNTQFLAFLGSFLAADYPAGGMSLMNLMLQLVGGLAIARALALPPAAPRWGLSAGGLLAVTLLNPGFVPRIDLAAYGEPALAVSALAAAWLFVSAQGAAAAGRRAGTLLPLALVLAALVNTKQSGIGLVAALAGAAVVAAAAEPGLPRAAALRRIGAAVLPAVLLYLLWRWWLAHAGVAELKLLPVAEWNWRTLPATVASALATVVEKPVYFGCVTIALAALPVMLRRQGWTPTTRLLALNAALFILYNAFLMLTYLAHFAPEMSLEAHSFFRYNTHLALVLGLALALAARDLGVGAALARGWARAAAGAAIGLILLAPFAFVGRLRFDLDMPQPLVWDLAKQVGRHVHDGDRLALLLPGDNGSVAPMLAGVLADTAPRRKGLQLLTRDRADAAALDEAARAGYRLALISCTPAGLLGLPPRQAVLLQHDAEGWHPVAAWPYPGSAYSRRWQHILAWGPLCR